MLKTRVITGAGLTVVFMVVFAISQFSWVLSFLAAALSIMGVYELNHAIHFLPNRCSVVLTGIGLPLLAIMPLPHSNIVTAVFLICAICSFLWLMRNIQKKTQIPKWLSWGTAIILPVFFRAMADIRKEPQGLLLLITAVLVSIATDVAAYFVEKGIGKHKLAPIVSPNKTIEGSLGGIAATLILLTLLITLAAEPGTVRYGFLMLYLITGSVIGQFGDLAMSSIKRITGIKDYGQLLPGHGGILDRFDSLLFVLPYTLLFSQTCPWLL